MEQDEIFTPDREELTAIVNCIGTDNLAELHNQLIQFYGDNGKDIYQSIKSGTAAFDKLDWSKEEKFLYYCALILRHSEEPEEALAEENIREFAQFVQGCGKQKEKSELSAICASQALRQGKRPQVLFYAQALCESIEPDVKRKIDRQKPQPARCELRLSTLAGALGWIPARYIAIIKRRTALYGGQCGGARHVCHDNVEFFFLQW